MKTVQIKETKYVRDLDSKAILNTNINALEQYKMEKKRLEDELYTGAAAGFGDSSPPSFFVG